MCVCVCMCVCIQLSGSTQRCYCVLPESCTHTHTSTHTHTRTQTNTRTHTHKHNTHKHPHTYTHTHTHTHTLAQIYCRYFIPFILKCCISECIYVTKIVYSNVTKRVREPYILYMTLCIQTLLNRVREILIGYVIFIVCIFVFIKYDRSMYASSLRSTLSSQCPSYTQNGHIIKRALYTLKRVLYTFK